jgi:trigger factor
MPDINLSEIENIKINLPNSDITDKDIDKVINNIQQQNTVWADSSDKSKSLDKVVVDYEGKINGESFKNNKQEDFSFVIDGVGQRRSGYCRTI